MPPLITPKDKAIGAQLAEERKAVNISQVTLAVAMGVNQPTVSYWEKGQTRMTAAHLADACYLLDLNINSFMKKVEKRLKNPPEPPTL